MLRSTIYADGFIGHTEAIEKLSNLIEGERLPHALLLSGPEGVGKSRAARWVAAAYLCPDHGCGQCPTCKKVLGGFHPDYFEVRPEEGRRDIVIAQIRTLNDAVQMKPFEAGGKAALLDVADRMNEEAQNALLKTLEEPPPATVIVLISAHAERLLPTIRSRCQQIRFNRLTTDELDDFLRRQEDLDPDFPAGLAQGSPGRLLELADADAGSVRSLMVEFITSEQTPSPVKAGSELMDWARAGSAGNLKHPVRERLRIALTLCAGVVRDLLVLQSGGREADLMNGDLEKALRRATKMYEMSGLFFAARAVVEAAADINSYIDPGLAAEKVFRVFREIRK